MVSLTQLVGLGLSPKGVESRLSRGSLHRIHRGVYAVGHARITPEGRYMAAALACGEGAVLSHRSAADLHRLLRSDRARVDVTNSHQAGRKLDGIELHRSRLDPRERTTVERIPCTTVSRTLLDLAETEPPRRLAHALDRAERLRLYDGRQVQAVLARAGGRRGAPRLREALDDWNPALTRTRSELERHFLELCRSAGLPEPEVNAPLDLGAGVTITPDFLWHGSDSSWRPTAGLGTAPGAPSRATASATSASPWPASSGCASPGARSCASPPGWSGRSGR